MLTPVKFGKGREHEPRLSPKYEPGRHSSRYWTDAESQVVREVYPTKGAAACAEKLPGRSLTGIYAHAFKLGVHSSFLTPKAAPVGDQHDARIRELWPLAAEKGGVAKIAATLGVRRDVVSVRALKLGLTLPHKKEPPWSAAEDALLRRAPVNSPDRASAFFKAHGFSRTATAIMVRCKRLDVSRRRVDIFSCHSAAKVLGIDSKRIARYIADGELKATLRGTKRLPQQGGDAFAIKPADFRDFILENLERLDIRKVEKHSFVALIAGNAK